ncbi:MULTISPECIES: acetyltransferase [Bacteroidota]|jgi:sugar O-acyltransferase (sialic acid O-acetyltransferase NeuD family)|uniref:Acetyltransferase n=1 Tax=Flectobacillus rivi TaxID=2984209 RepID=A0ABT6YZ63_9BACT|nr:MULTISPECIES: acetyltransferase [Bacteroidota]MDI9874170.1 acetyltransferase [Flectobacillus rivi]NBB29290.1 sugar O-acyltransferase [Cellulophaga sp. BC115SP]PAC31205.1 sugar O-acyltransferase [Flectobacillus sp. BAB-3569]
MAKVVVFGTELVAELAHYYLTTDTDHEIVAFTVNQEYIKEPTFCGLPVVPFEEVTTLYPTNEYKFFAPLSERKMNQVRAKVYQEAKDLGYEFISYISSRATVLTDKIGENCFILEDNTIQPFVTIGNNVVLWSGNHIGHHGTIKDHVYFTSHVVLSGRCVVEPYCFFGVNATIRDGVHIAEGTLFAMGTNFTGKKTEPWSIYKGNPAEKAKISSKDINL